MSDHHRRFDPAHAHKLEDPDRLKWMPPEDILEALGLSSGQRIADIGAGLGYYAIPVARQVGAAGVVVAVDVSSEMLGLLRAKLQEAPMPQNITLVEGSAEATTLGEDEFDRVLVANVWHEVDDEGRALAEWRRILKPDGLLVLQDWRTDIHPEPGPPMNHRVPMARTVQSMMEGGWTVTANRAVGRYSYLVTAVPS